MTLTTHAVVGAGVAALLPTHPVLGICAAFASHFVLDAIPHYDYPIRSASINPKLGGTITLDHLLALDLLSIGTDFLLGLALAALIFATPETLPYILVAAFAGQLPDALQFAYLKWRHEPLITLQRFHKWIHTPHRLRGHPQVGWVSQAALLIAFVVLVRLFAL